MTGTVSPEGIVLAHSLSGRPRARAQALTRLAREDSEDLCLAPGATRSSGAGRRAVLEEPDPLRTCFERDHDRILHSSAFRRLAGKTQVFVFPGTTSAPASPMRWRWPRWPPPWPGPPGSTRP